MASKFRVAARALRQFGAELITSDDIALNELIKNAFDARSRRVEIHISAPADPATLLSILEGLSAGKYKNPEQPIDAIGKALATELSIKERQEFLSFFGSATRAPESLAAAIKDFLEKKFRLSITDKGRGMSKADLENNFLVIGTPNKWIAKNLPSQGDGDVVLGEKGIGRLSMMRLGSRANVKSGTVQEKTWNVVEFNWHDFDDPALSLEDVSVTVKSAGTKKFDEHGTTIEVFGLTSYWTRDKAEEFIRNYVRRLQDPFEETLRPYPVDVFFNGERLTIAGIPPWLINAAQFKAEVRFNPNAVGAEPMLSRKLRWHNASSDEVRTWPANTLVQILDVPVQVLKRLGPLLIQCLWFNRQQLISNDIEHSQKKITDELNLWCGGFAIYRDGFRIGQTGGMEDDWLEMDKIALRAKGYTFNRYQTVGSVQISSKANTALIDAANRERLVSCPEFETLREILGNILISDLRSHIGAIKELEVKKGISEESTEQSLKKSEKDLTHTIKLVTDIGKAIPATHREKLNEVKEVLTAQADNVRTLRRALELAREQRMEILELAGVGLVVEIVIHELVRLTERTTTLLSKIESDSSTTPELERVIETLRLQIRATNKRIRTVDVMSPSGRHRKERFDLMQFIQSIIEGYDGRLKRHEIDVELIVDGATKLKRFEVEMVQGLVGQVVENLLTNSIYWVQQGTVSDCRTISIELDTRAQTISVTDNGPGIDPQNAKDVFKPYFTTKRKGKGLGLFIASELSSYHGGKLYLDESPAQDGRLRTFTLELPKQ